MTNEATRLAEEAKRLVVAALNIAESTMPPFIGVTPGQQAICAALDAIDALATLAQPAVSEDGTLIPVGLGREEIRRLICAQPAAKGDEARYAAPVRMERAKGDTVAEMRLNLSQLLWMQGDAVLCWVNEGDYIRSAMASQEKPHD